MLFKYFSLLSDTVVIFICISFGSKSLQYWQQSWRIRWNPFMQNSSVTHADGIEPPTHILCGCRSSTEAMHGWDAIFPGLLCILQSQSILHHCFSQNIDRLLADSVIWPNNCRNRYYASVSQHLRTGTSVMIFCCLSVGCLPAVYLTCTFTKHLVPPPYLTLCFISASWDDGTWNHSLCLRRTLLFPFALHPNDRYEIRTRVTTVKGWRLTTWLTDHVRFHKLYAYI